MSKQAINCIRLFKGNAPSNIRMAIDHLTIAVVSELMREYQVDDLDELSVALSK